MCKPRIHPGYTPDTPRIQLGYTKAHTLDSCRGLVAIVNPICTLNQIILRFIWGVSVMYLGCIHRCRYGVFVVYLTHPGPLITWRRLEALSHPVDSSPRYTPGCTLDTSWYTQIHPKIDQVCTQGTPLDTPYIHIGYAPQIHSRYGIIGHFQA